jgi:hypothetical protein
MVVSGSAPNWVPEDIFSPRRLLQSDPLFLSERDGLWRVADSLCQQLQIVNRRISDELMLQGNDAGPTALAHDVSGPEGQFSPEPATAASLAGLACFRSFQHRELARLAKLMRRWELPGETILFSEGSHGGSCYIISEGEIDVTIQSGRGQQRSPLTCSAMQAESDSATPGSRELIVATGANCHATFRRVAAAEWAGTFSTISTRADTQPA